MSSYITRKQIEQKAKQLYNITPQYAYRYTCTCCGSSFGMGEKVKFYELTKREKAKYRKMVKTLITKE